MGQSFALERVSVLLFITLSIISLLFYLSNLRLGKPWIGLKTLEQSRAKIFEEKLWKDLQVLTRPSTPVRVGKATSWNYTIYDDLTHAKNCQPTVHDILHKELSEEEIANGLSQILKALVLIPVNSTALFVGKAQTVKRFEEIFAAVDLKEECKYNVQVNVVNSVHEYIQINTHKRASLVFLGSPCETDIASFLKFIMREGGMIYVASDVSHSCAQISENFIQTNFKQLFINPMTEPSFPEIWEAVLISSVLAMELEGWRTLFKGMGHIAEVRLELQQIHSLLYRAPEAIHVCEIGFNAGHSAILFLSASTKIQLTSFDLGNLPWSSDMKKRIEYLFPGRFTYIQGNSRDVVPEFATLIKSNLASQCDVMLVDGDHSYEGAKIDFTNSMKIMVEGGILLADDYSNSFPGVMKAWKELADAKMMEHIKAVSLGNLYNGYHKGWAIGRITKLPTSQYQSEEVIHVASTQCGETDLELIEVLVKSLILWLRPNERLVFHLIANQVPQPLLLRLQYILESAKMVFEVHDAKLERLGVNLFSRCAMERLMLPELLPNVSHIIYLDRDTLALSSVGDLYRKRFAMHGKVMALAAEGHGWYTAMGDGKNRYFGTTGLNSGVALMNLQLMRKLSFTEKLFSSIPGSIDLRLGDQDLINQFFERHAETLMLIECEYNYRLTPDGRQECECVEFDEIRSYVECDRKNNIDDAVILHGNRMQFMNTSSILYFIWTLIRETNISFVVS